MSCDLPITYNDDTWSRIVSPDQEGCNAYLESIKPSLKNEKCLHVGIGTSSVLAKFHAVLDRIDGITVMDSEIEVANRLRPEYGLEYKIFKFNKYDAKNLKLLSNNYSIIIDNNLKQHACCQQHWEQYFLTMLSKLSKHGRLITHTQGFAPHTNRVGWLSLGELQMLMDGVFRRPYRMVLIDDLINEAGHYPVVIEHVNGHK